jgi:hypothetical protein
MVTTQSHGGEYYPFALNREEKIIELSFHQNSLMNRIAMMMNAIRVGSSVMNESSSSSSISVFDQQHQQPSSSLMNRIAMKMKRMRAPLCHERAAAAAAALVCSSSSSSSSSSLPQPFICSTISFLSEIKLKRI